MSQSMSFHLSSLFTSDVVKDTSTLVYRGIAYEVPRSRLHRSERISTAPIKPELIYRGVRYNPTVVVPKAYAATISQRLLYRGATYVRPV